MHATAVLDNRYSWQIDMLVVEKLYMKKYLVIKSKVKILALEN